MDFETLQQQNIFEAGPITVGKFIEQINRLVKPVGVKIIGEVSEAKCGPTGHMYFSLKDENGPPSARLAQTGGGAVMSCAIWRSRYEMFGIQLKAGMKVIAAGHCEIYAPSGRLSFICDSIELAGEGALKKEYDRLLAKLTAEGIFAAEKKRAIPKFCRRIGIITSKQGAVIHDFLNNIGKFGFAIEFIDSRVEGQLAVGDLLASIRTFKKRKVDVLVIMRGGGSLEAMMAFNNELIVREIAAFPVPVIAGIGHDKDVSLAAMAADAMCSTPTAAANLLTQSWQEIFRALEHYQTSIIGGYQNLLSQKQNDLRQYAGILNNFRYIIKNISELIDAKIVGISNNYQTALFRHRSQLKQYSGILNNFKYILQNIKKTFTITATNFATTIKTGISNTRKQIDYFEKIIKSHNPERQLKLGYSISKINGKILKSAQNIKIGDNLEVHLSDGIINSQTTKIKLYGNQKEN